MITPLDCYDALVIQQLQILKAGRGSGGCGGLRPGIGWKAAWRVVTEWKEACMRWGAGT